MKDTEYLPISDKNSTRFWIRLREANQFVLKALLLAVKSQGGEIYAPLMDSVRITDIAEAVRGPNVVTKETGLRPGDKLHETLITESEGRRVVMRDGIYVIQPESPIWPYTRVYTKVLPKALTSDDNKFLTLSGIRDSIREYLPA